MIHVSEMVPRVDETRPLRAHFYKTDHPRAIDRHIDFFGDRTARAEADDCEDVVLASLA
jgi:hypothetical protein